MRVGEMDRCSSVKRTIIYQDIFSRETWIFLYRNTCLPEPWVTNMISMSDTENFMVKSILTVKRRRGSGATSKLVRQDVWAKHIRSQRRVIHRYV